MKAGYGAGQQGVARICRCVWLSAGTCHPRREAFHRDLNPAFVLARIEGRRRSNHLIEPLALLEFRQPLIPFGLPRGQLQPFASRTRSQIAQRTHGSLPWALAAG